MHRNYINPDEKSKSAAELNEIGPYIWENSFEEYSKYNWKKDRKIQFTCTRCGKPCVMVRQYIKQFICKSCMCKDREANKDKDAIRNKYQATMLERYGVTNPGQMDGFKERVAATSKARYGTEHYSQCEEARKRSSDMRKQWKREGRYKEITDKAQNTLRERYGYDMSDPSVIQRLRDGSREKFGTDFPMQSEACRKQVQDTVKAKYGVDSVNQLESKKAAARRTCIENYGVPYYSETPDFLEDWKETLQERYGVDNPMFHPKIRKKMKDTMMERYEVDNAAYIDRRSPLLVQQKPVEYDTVFLGKSDSLYQYRCSECGAEILSPFMNPSCSKCHPRDNSDYVHELAYMIKMHYTGDVQTHPNKRFPADIWIPEFQTAIIINMTYYISSGQRNNGIIINNDVIHEQLEEFYRWNPDGMVFIITETEFKQFKQRILQTIKCFITEQQKPVDSYVMEINKKDAQRFLNQYYNPDPRHYDHSLGLFSGADLIAVAGFNMSNHICRITDIQVKPGWAPELSLLFDEMTASYGATKILYAADYRITNAAPLFDCMTYDGLAAPGPVYYYNGNICYLHKSHMEAETKSLMERAYDGSLSPYENLENQAYMFYDAGKILFSIRRFVI